MTATKLIAALLLGFSMASVSWRGAEAKEKKPNADQGSDSDKLISAARSCNLPALKALIGAGVNLSAIDGNGLDALSYASLDRADMPVSAANKLFSRSGSGTNAKWAHIQWTLKCPQAVAALTEAGADPWKAKFYQSPRLDENRPEMIAFIRAQDNREKKGDSEKIMEAMVDGVQTQLRGGGTGLGHLEYPILGLSEVRQKLRTSGFSADDTMAPDRVKACKALGADSVFEASLEDYRSASIGIVSSSTTRMKFTLTGCKSGELLWQSDLDYPIAEGWIARAFGGSKVKQVATGFVGPPAVSFPPYEKR